MCYYLGLKSKTMKVSVDYILSNKIEELKLFIKMAEVILKYNESFPSRKHHIKHVKKVIKNHKRDMKKMKDNDKFNAYTNLQYLKAYLALIKI